jgi:hypothetical protein
MVRSAIPGPSDHPVERARATFDQGIRAVKTWWRSRDVPVRPGGGIDLTTEPHDSQPSSSNGTGDAVVAHVTEELDRMRRDVERNDVELLQALQRLAASYERVVERLESDRRERRMLAEAVLRLERRISQGELASGSAGELSSGERVTGGWVMPVPEPDSPPHAAESATTLDASASEKGANGVDPIHELFADHISDSS